MEYTAKVVHVGDPVLREVAKPMPIEEISSPDTAALIAAMKAALADEQFGVALAAPQIAQSQRVFIVSGKVIASRAKEDYDPERHRDEVYINPDVLRSSKKQSVGDEGCLSIPGKYGIRVKRSEKVTISYYDEHGEQHERGASGFLARIFQHEIDHLNGILYTDHALEVIDVDENLKPLHEHTSDEEPLEKA